MQALSRRELKYIISLEEKEYLLACCAKHCRLDEYGGVKGSYPVLSQYYDSPNLLFYREKLAGICSRRKLRIRCYSPSLSKSPLFMEIKERSMDRVWKIRREITPDSFSPQGIQDFDELEALAQSPLPSPLLPSGGVFFQRKAFESTNPRSGRVRVTFDSCLLGLYPCERLSNEHFHSPARWLIAPGKTILELKLRDELPSWFLQAVLDLGLERISISKYCLAVDKLSWKLTRQGECRA